MRARSVRIPRATITGVTGRFYRLSSRLGNGGIGRRRIWFRRGLGWLLRGSSGITRCLSMGVARLTSSVWKGQRVLRMRRIPLRWVTGFYCVTQERLSASFSSARYCPQLLLPSSRSFLLATLPPNRSTVPLPTKLTPHIGHHPHSQKPKKHHRHRHKRH